MKNKKLGLGIIIASSALVLGGLVFVNAPRDFARSNAAVHDANCEWNHYEAVDPTIAKHGSKEFWACCTHPGEFELAEPAVGHITDRGAFSGEFFEALTDADERFVERLDGNRFVRMDVIGWQDSALLYSTAQYTDVTKVTFRFRHTGETFAGLWLAVAVNDSHSDWVNLKNFSASNDGEWHEVTVDSINKSGYVGIAYNMDHVIEASFDVDDIVIYHAGGTATENFEVENNYIFTLDQAHAQIAGEPLPGPMNSFARMDVIGWKDSALLYSTAQYTNVTKVTFRFRHTGETFEGLWKAISVNDTHSDWVNLINFNETNDGEWHEVTVDSINKSGYVGFAYNMDHVINATFDIDDVVIFHDGGVATEDFEDENNLIFTLDSTNAHYTTAEIGNVSLGVVALDALETTVEKRKGYASTFTDSTGVDLMYGPYVQLNDWQCASNQNRCWIGMTQTKELSQIKAELHSEVITAYFFYVYNPLDTSFVLDCMLLSSSGTNPNTKITLAPKAWTKITMQYGLTDNGSYPALTEAHQIGFDHTASNGAVIGDGFKFTSIYATGPVNYFVRIDAGVYSSSDAPLYSNDQYEGITSVTFDYRVIGGIAEGKGGWLGIGISGSHNDYTGLRTHANDACDGEWHTKTYDLSGSPVDGYVNMVLACGEFQSGTTIDFDNIIITYSGGQVTERFENGYNSFTYKASHASEIHLIEHN